MTEAQTILKMIEEVDPADTGALTATLDEIDGMVVCFIKQWDDFNEYDVMDMWSHFRATERNGNPWWAYTRSRDALKNARDEHLPGWLYECRCLAPILKIFQSLSEWWSRKQLIDAGKNEAKNEALKEENDIIKRQRDNNITSIDAARNFWVRYRQDNDKQ